jgi:AmmeMemoRadiSam system protein B
VAFGEGVKIVPVMIPPVDDAAAWGREIGRVLADWPEPVVMLASSDLTHYGPNYQFTPMGVGEEGRRWAMEVNDRRLLGLIERMQSGDIVGETQRAHNACGGGAIAATIACCQVLGAEAGHVLCHSDSTAELAAIGYGDSMNSVGYAGVVFG